MAARGPRAGKRADQRGREARAAGRDARQELLSAAAEVFVERGFHDTSVDEVAERAGYSKGTVYWHFAGKEDLFLALVEERVHRPTRELIELLRSAPGSQDMAPEANRRFAELLSGQREWLVLDHEHWLRAVRDPELREREAAGRRELRTALAGALAARVKTLGGGPIGVDPERIATAIMALDAGLAQQALIDPDAVPGDLFGDTIALIYRGLRARAEDVGADGGATAAG